MSWPPVEHACSDCGAFPGERHAPACDAQRKLHESYTGMTFRRTDWRSQADDAREMKRAMAASYARQAMTVTPTPILGKAAVGLHGDVLVCDDQETEGDAPGKCRKCGAGVRVRNGHIPLFGGREDPPEIQCMECRDEEDKGVSVVHDGISVDFGVDNQLIQRVKEYTKELEKIKDATWKLQVSQELVADEIIALAKATKDAGLFVSCVECGASLKGGKGVVRCKKCQRRSWRRSKA